MKLTLRKLVGEWVKANCKHHYMYSIDKIWCGCATGLFTIHDNSVNVAYGELGEHRFTLSASDPKFFDHLKHYIKETCEKNLL